MSRIQATAVVPRIHPWLCWGFRRFVRRYLRRHFHQVRLLRQTLPPWSSAQSWIFYANHPSWWDPLIAIFLQDTFVPQARFFAPIDAAALREYPLFGRLGFFGVQQQSLAGGKDFLRTSRAILAEGGVGYWVTPSGHFQDVRQPSHFRAGLSHLAAMVQRQPDWGVRLLPVAIELTFWQERCPEILVAFGRPSDPHTEQHTRDAWNHVLEERLAEAQQDLAAAAVDRRPELFESLLTGALGVGGFYDRYRSWRAAWRGESFDPRHQRSLEGRGEVHEWTP